MSWQATAWAEKQVTGSPARKVLLLVLANYADEGGYCWPSQKTLAAGTEQSLDTVQRQLKRLAADGFVTVTKRQRLGGHWEGHAYQLNMKMTEPQNAAWSKPPALESNRDPAAKCGPAEPQPARPPGRKLCGTNSNIIITRTSTAPATSSIGEAPRAAKRTRREIQDLQSRVVRKLGNGDDQAGWERFGSLTAHQRRSLEDAETDGLLDAARVGLVCGACG